MGKTVQIDDDVMRAAERLAAERGTTPDAVISDAARKSLVQPAAAEKPEMRHGFLYEDGWYVLPSRGGVVTTELVRKIQEELDWEDARLAGRERSPGADG
jgi:hypothetical protein